MNTTRGRSAGRAPGVNQSLLFAVRTKPPQLGLFGRHLPPALSRSFRSRKSVRAR